MKRSDNETTEQILEESVKVVSTVQDAALRADLLSAMSLLAEEKFSKQVIENFIRR